MKTSQQLATSALAHTWVKRAEVVEDSLIWVLLAGLFWIFSTQVNSQFTLPKMNFAVFVVAMLQIPLAIRIFCQAVHRVSLWCWMPLALLVVWWFVATSQAMHPTIALEGLHDRYNGLYTHLVWAALFFTMANMRLSSQRVQRLLIGSLLILLPVCLYTYHHVIVYEHKRPYSSIGNAVILATVLMLFVPFNIMLLVRSQLLKSRIQYSLIALLILAALLFTVSRGPILATVISLVVMVGLYAFYYRHNLRQHKLLLIGMGCLVLLVGVAVAVLLLNIDKIRVGATGSTSMRFIYFQAAWEVVKHHPLFGLGFESFVLAYPGYRPDDEWQVIQDMMPSRVHNDYLRIAIDNGLPALLFYLVLVGSILWQLLGLIHKASIGPDISIAFIAAIIAYLAQGMTGWFEVSSTMTYWLILGMASGYVLHNKSSPATGRQWQFPLITINGGAFVLCLVYAWVMLGEWAADHYLRQAKQLMFADPEVGKLYINKLHSVRPDNYYYQDQIGLLRMRYSYQKDRSAKQREEAYYRARQHLLRATELNPFDPYVLVHIGENDVNAVRMKMIARPSKEALAAVGKLVELDFNNPTAHRVAADVYALAQQQEKSDFHRQRMRQLQSNKRGR